MATCNECDSPVAENDAFCPVCGISLQQDVVPTPVGEDSFDGTILMKPEERAKAVAAPTKPESTVSKAADPIEPGGVSKAKSDKPASESGQTASDDIPTPALLDSLTATGKDLPVTPTSEYKFETPKTEESIDAATPDLIDFGFPKEDGKAPTATADPEDAKDTAEQVFSTADEVAAPIEDTPVAQDVNPFEQATPPNIPELTSASNDVAAAEPTAAKDRFSAPPEPDFKIAKPDIELAEFDSPASGPMYDSVRIVENRIPDQENIATRIPSKPTFGQVEAASHVKAEPRPYTAPNIGEGDTDGRRGAKLKPLTEGTILNGRYEIVRKIGGGGMGAVYLASDNNLGGVLRAVKEMVQAHIEEDQQEKAINDFKRESMILSTLDHPSIPTIFDYFYDESESRFYLVMKYISGGDLSARIRSAPEGKIDESTVTEWAIQIIDVLSYLHSQPSTIVYRDLKPSNIMIDGNSGRVMLIDFGIARSISQKEQKGVTAVGTMGYAPPELFSGNVEPRSDIYSLGSTMFHLLTGADPQSNPLLIFDFQKNPRPRQINPRLSDQIEQILMRSVEYSADSRFSSASEMKAVLEQHLSNLKAGNVTFGVSEAPISVSLANQSVFCGFCGQRIVATDLFCAFCGAKQPLAQQGVHSEIYAKPVVTAKLLIEGTADLNMPAFALQKDENLLGRRDPMSNIFPEVDLSKYDPQTKISRRHARIWRDGGNFLVEDLGSSNGTIVAALGTDALRLLPHKPHVLASGDKLKVGDTTLHFVIE